RAVGGLLQNVAEESARDPVTRIDGPQPGRHLTAAVIDRNDVFSQQRDQALHVAESRRAQELLGNTLLLRARRLEARLVFGQSPSCPNENLSTVRFGLVDDVRDVRIVVVEDFAQYEYRALEGRQLFQHHQEGERQRLAQHQRLGQI